MRKATGKVVSLVLALALVVTSFSSTFALAATKSESAIEVHAKDGTVYLANLSNYADSAEALQEAKGKGQNLFNITEYVMDEVNSGANAPWLETDDHINVNDELEISSVSVSGDNIIRVSKVTENDLNGDKYPDNFAKVGDYVATVRDVKGTGTATVKVLYTAKTTERGEDEITVRGSKNFDIVLLDAMTPVMIPDTDKFGDEINNLQKNPQWGGNLQTDETDTIAAGDNYNYYAYDMNDDGKAVYDTGKPVSYATAKVVLPRASSNSAAATSEPVTLIKATDEKKYGSQGLNDYDNKYEYNEALAHIYIVSASGTNNFLEVADNTVTYGVAKPSVGNTIRLSIASVKVVKDDEENEELITNVATNKVVEQGTAKVQNKVVGDFSSVDLGDGSQAKVGLNKNDTVLSKSKAYVKLEDDRYWDVTGADIEATKSGVSISGGKLGSVTASGNVTMANGTVGDITAEGNSIEVTGGSTGDLTASNVTVSGATVASITDADVVTVEEGTVSGDISANDVTLAPVNEEASVTVNGTVKATLLSVDGTSGKVAVNGYFAVEDGEEGGTNDESKLTLMGGKASINKIDVDYRNTEIVLDAFQGTIPAIQNGKYTGYSETGAVLKSEYTDTSYDDTRATVNGNMELYTVELNSGAVTFNGNLKVNNVYGSDADFIINAGALYVVDSIATSNTLKIANPADVALNTVVYSATSDIADENSFVGYGFTVKTVAGTNSDSFVIDGVSFSGLSMSQSSAEVVVGDSITLTASAYPNGTTLPANTKIRFYYDCDETYISGVDNGDGTATLTAKAYSSDFSILNKATVTAVVTDEFDIDLEEYGTAVCVVTVVPQASSTYTSDTTGNVDVKSGETYQFKITSLNGQTPNFGIGSPSAFRLVASSQTGNDYFFKVQAVGNIGDACGIYINGDPNKVAVLHVTADYTCDTTTVNVAVGASYQVKITANSQPTLAAGNSIYTVELASQSGNDYFFKITATQNAKAGDQVGFYVNGGARAFVATTV